MGATGFSASSLLLHAANMVKHPKKVNAIFLMSIIILSFLCFLVELITRILMNLIIRVDYRLWNRQTVGILIISVNLRFAS